jgi:hypothetical protein
MFEHRCRRCLGTWETVLENPKRCGVCGSALWGEKPKRKPGAGRPKGAVSRKREAENLVVTETESEGIVIAEEDDPLGGLMEGRRVEFDIPADMIRVSEVAKAMRYTEEQVWSAACGAVKVARPKHVGDGTRMVAKAWANAWRLEEKQRGQG